LGGPPRVIRAGSSSNEPKPGTPGGQVYASADSGDTWEAIAEYLPRVSSVEVQTLP